jgi:hypothetical protein
MTGHIALMVALAVYANDYLYGSGGIKLSKSNSTLKYCGTVYFVDLEGNKEIVIANSVNEWFEYLKENKAFRLRMHYVRVHSDDRDLVAFVGGGGRWVIEVLRNEESDYYESHWVSNTPGGWTVKFARLAKNQKPPIRHEIDLDKEKNELRNDLINILAFAEDNNISFAEWFRKSLECLESENPLAQLRFYTDVVPRHFLPLEAEQILTCCVNSWVFGGMGSWNDIGYPKEEAERYRQISDGLYQGIQKGIAAAVNSK